MRVSIGTQRGVTLIELMVAMTLGVIILGSALAMFSANKQSFRFSKALARVQDNGRFAIQSMARDIRMAGYIGCSSRQQVAIDTTPAAIPAASLNLTNALFGYDDGLTVPAGLSWWQGAILTDHLGQNLVRCEPGSDPVTTGVCQISDALDVWRGSETAIELAQASVAGADGTLVVTEANFNTLDPPIATLGNPPTLDGGGNLIAAGEDLVLVTDCSNADVFKVGVITTDGTLRTLNYFTEVQNSYPAGALVMPLVMATYFVAYDNADEDGDGNADGVPALYRLGLRDTVALNVPVAIPIAKGVERLNVFYGVDTVGDEYADLYLATAAEVTDWSRVVSVRIAILIKSKDDFITDGPVPVPFLGTVVNDPAVPGADSRLRLVFSTTVGLRNRVP